MHRTPPARRLRARFLAGLLALVVPLTLHGQGACPGASGADGEAGWTAYRAGDTAGARARFEAALARCPDDLYAATGLGYVALREGDAARAHALFSRVVAARPSDYRYTALILGGSWVF